jgi:arylsulfatase
MNRRELLRTLGYTAGIGLLSSVPRLAQAATPRRRVNILFLMDDQHRGDCLGAAGATWLKTPHLDELAHQGALFVKAYSSLPSCLPARTSLLTGQSPWQHGMLGYKPIPPRFPQEMPRMFSQAGYRTHAVGKMHFEDHDHGYQSVVLEEAWRAALNRPKRIKRDYRRWFEARHPDKDVDATGLGYTDHRGGHPFPYGDTLHPTHWTAEQGIEFLRSYREDKPWFLKVSFKRPHPPFDPPKRWLDHYDNVKFPMPKVGPWAERKFGQGIGSLEKNPNATRGHFPGAEIRASRQAYFASISHVDEQVGRVLQALQERGDLENTLILFTCDHGDMMGDNHLWRKCYAYEGSARIPMIIRWPESLNLPARRGQVMRHLVELRDVLPTFLDAAGMAKPGAMDGMSMLDLIRGRTRKWRRVLDLEHAQIYWQGNSWIALTDGRHKYIYFTLTGEQQLFDLDNDPHEMNNLAENAAHAELVGQWRKRMVEHVSIRGEAWVKDGDLTIQKKPVYYSPHFPKK